ncbi:MAG: branched-chain amino acid ABC transporter permease [Mesorhizobium sp.]|nr:branched-chain amino acid ABC transporter permease [Mesorhizobium sp.]
MGTALIGLVLGMVLFLLSSGVTIIFGVLGVINFAHATYFTLGAFLTFSTVQLTGSYWLAFPVAALVAGSVGAVQEVLTFRPIYRHAHFYQLIASLGFSVFMLAILHSIWGLDYKNVPQPEIFSSSIAFAGSQLSTFRLFVVAVGFTACVAILYVIDRTRVGLVIRAASTNADMIACLGVDVVRLRTWVLAVGSAAAAVAGVIVAPIMAVQLDMGGAMLLDSFLVAVLAGLGSIRGAIVVSILIGMARAYGQLIAPEWIQIVIYGGALAFLMIRPAGLFGRKVRTA